MTKGPFVFCLRPPDQVSVDAPGGADVGLHCVLVLAQLSAQAQVLEEAEQELLPLRPPHRVVVLRLLLLQHLERQGRNPGGTGTLVRSGFSQSHREGNISKLDQPAHQSATWPI